MCPAFLQSHGSFQRCRSNVFSFPRGGDVPSYHSSEASESKSDALIVDPEGEGLHSYVEGLNFGGEREVEKPDMGGNPLLPGPVTASPELVAIDSVPNDIRQMDHEGEGMHDYINGLNFDGNLEAEIFAEGADPFHLFENKDDNIFDSSPGVERRFECRHDSWAFDVDEGREAEFLSVPHFLEPVPRIGCEGVVGHGGDDFLIKPRLNDVSAHIGEQFELTAENREDDWSYGQNRFDYD